MTQLTSGLPRIHTCTCMYTHMGTQRFPQRGPAEQLGDFVNAFRVCCCLNYCSVAVRRHQDQGNIKESISLGAGLQFQKVSPCRHGRKQTDVALEGQLRAVHPHPWAAGRETSKATSRDTPPPARPHLLILRQLHSPVTTHSNIGACGGLWGPLPSKPLQLLTCKGK